MATIQTLLMRAIYRSGLRDRQADPNIPGSEVETALDEFNSANNMFLSYMPFIDVQANLAVAGLANTSFVSVNAVYYVLQNVRYELKNCGFNQYQHERSLENLNSIPQFYWFDEGTKTVNVYPTPTTGTFTVYGQSNNGVFAITDAIPTNWDPLYEDILISETAFRLCNEYGIEWTQQKNASYEAAKRKLADRKQIAIDPIGKVTITTHRGSMDGLELYYISGGTS